MTEINADTEKAPEMGAKNMSKPGATMLTFSGAALVAAIIGIFLAAFTKEMTAGTTPTVAGLVVILPAIIGAIQRTTSDKPVTWYRTQAIVIGALLGLLVGYASF